MRVVRKAPGTVLVLIYPYWNVNDGYSRKGKAGRHVLIYPYWNVNFKGVHAGNESKTF